MRTYRFYEFEIVASEMSQFRTENESGTPTMIYFCQMKSRFVKKIEM